jgi:K+-transporting ATPase ATPase C chain
MLTQLKQAILCFLVLTFLTGVGYPLLVTAVAQVVFNNKANGSLLTDNKGSSLIGQSFDDPKYFWGRLSGCNYNAAASSGTNFAMTNAALLDAAKTRIEVLKQSDPTNTSPIPVDLVTASGSGLDPHISVEAARYQADRVARVRGVGRDTVDQMIHDSTDQPLLGFIGESRVNVVLLNRALDERR